MMETILITGSNGEIGSQLLSFVKKNNTRIIAFDINEPITNYKNVLYIKDTISNEKIIKKLFNDFAITQVYHFAALLSQSAIKDPQLAKQVNEEGSRLIIDSAFDSGIKNRNFVRFFFPSSIAVYGPRKLIKAKEADIIQPTTIYGKNKLVIEQYGAEKHEQSYKSNSGIDFRSIRFPGIISPYTIPNGGTTDFAPQMLHAAATFLSKNNKENYECMLKRVNEFVNFINKNDPEANVIITSDHAHDIKDFFYLRYDSFTLVKTNKEFIGKEIVRIVTGFGISLQ